VSAWRRGRGERETGDVKETRLDQVMRTWPDIRRTKQEWAEFAERTAGGAFSRHHGQSLDSISDDELLGSPLPQSEEESHKCGLFSGETREAEAGIMGQQNIERDRKTFRDLAQLASQPSLQQRGSISEIRPSQRDVTGAAKGSDSGLIDFGTLGQPERGSVDRASVTPLASTDLADSEDLPTAPKISVTPPPLPPSVRALQPPIAAAIHTPLAISASQRAPHAAQIMSAQAALLAAEPEPSRGTMGRVVALLGVAAVAAGAFLVVRTLRAPNAQGEHIVVSTAAAAPHAAPAPTPTPAADRGIDPMSLPQAGALNAQPVLIATSGHHVHHAHHGVAKNAAGGPAPGAANDDSDDSDDSTTAAPVAAAAPPPAPKPDATPAVATPVKAAPTPAWLQGALGEAITKAAAPAAPAAPAADPAPAPVPVPAAAPVSASGSVPQHPSQGAVTSALSGALPGARACLGADDDVSRVRVVFGSDGAVQSMTVTGFAAGKPQEACIKGALGKAHVPPFAEATYGANVNVRP
jgi:hypothetical protein